MRRFLCPLLVVCVVSILISRSWCLAADSVANPILSALVQADSILIQDDWTGLSPEAPINAHYHLRRNAKGFAGEAHFSVAGYSGRPRETSENILVPSDASQRFLRLLAGAPLTRGKYTPAISHTDDYPSRTIEIGIGQQKIVFFSESQGKDNVPWKVTVSQDDFVSNSSIPGEALTSLREHLKRDVLQNLLNRRH